jgi:ferredoxin
MGVTHNLRVEVDRMVCMRSGDCARLAPQAFTIDEEEIAVVTDPSAVGEDTLRLVERNCPSGAISVEDGGD